MALSSDAGTKRLLGDDEWAEKVIAAICTFCQADRVPVSMAALRALGHLLRFYVKKSDGQEMPPPQTLAILTKVRDSSVTIYVDVLFCWISCVIPGA